MARSPADAVRLEAVAVANRLHSDLDLRQRVTDGNGVIDVFSAIAELGIPLVFKPLESALGLCLPAPLSGIMVTTKRGLHIQRFTGAHELGHTALEHQGSVDREIMERGPNYEGNGRDLNEIAADAFAAEFLLPRWLYRHHIMAQGWSLAYDLKLPETIYQLSLRMSVSYDAACWGLLSHKIMPWSQVQTLRKARPSNIKSDLGDGHRPTDSWSDVWRVTERDNGASLTGNPEDLFRIELDETPGSGHQWSMDVLVTAGWELLEDHSDFQRAPLLYGAPSRRVVIARAQQAGVNQISLQERQPWAPSPKDDKRFQLAITLRGPERAGLSRADRAKLGLVG